MSRGCPVTYGARSACSTSSPDSCCWTSASTRTSDPSALRAEHLEGVAVGEPESAVVPSRTRGGQQCLHGLGGGVHRQVDGGARRARGAVASGRGTPTELSANARASRSTFEAQVLPVLNGSRRGPADLHTIASRAVGEPPPCTARCLPSSRTGSVPTTPCCTVDAIVFTAGVGHNDGPCARPRMSGLERLGVEVDPVRIESQPDGAFSISLEGDDVPVLVVPTDEKWRSPARR